jgi:hypothetical protein
MKAMNQALSADLHESEDNHEHSPRFAVGVPCPCWHHRAE